MSHSGKSIGITSAQINILFREFIVVAIMAYYFHGIHAVFTSATAMFLGDFDPDVSYPPRILQVIVLSYFLSQLLPDRMFLAFRFDLGF